MADMDEYDTSLQQAREQFPGWDIIRVMGSYIAVPTGTVIVQGMFVSSVVEKIQEQEKS